MKKQFLIQVLSFTILFFTFLSCEQNNIAPIETKVPIVLIIGHDDSGTFDEYVPLSKTELKEIALSIANSGREGMIGVAGIGNPSDKPFLRLHIKAVPTIDLSKTLRFRVKQQKEREAIINLNKDAINSFVNAFTKMNLGQNEQAYTDINGFNLKTLKLLNEPPFKGHEKIVLIYSDGKHDVKRDKVLKCTFESIPHLELCTIGWKQEEVCKNILTIPFESTLGFTQYFSTKF